MSEPRRDYQDALHGALLELTSGVSALNMHPEPIPEAQQTDSSGYLSDVDGWVKHSVEHFRAALELVNKGMQDLERLKFENFRLKEENKRLKAELKKV